MVEDALNHVGDALPDLFRRDDGSRISTAAEWPAHVATQGERMVRLAYGGMPPPPEQTLATLLHRIEVAQLDRAPLSNWRIATAPTPHCAFIMQLLRPAGASRYPVIVSGDACWRHTSEAAVAEVLRRGYALAQFNRVEIAADVTPDASTWRQRGLYGKVPGSSFGAIAAWAWGYHRCVDALSAMDDIDSEAIAVLGHSRGGKAALLAGATDARVALTSANNSGTGGSGSFRAQGAGSETLAQLIGAFPHWMGPELAPYCGRESELPSDQHLLKAMVAPRALLTTDALGDAWANPPGCWRTYQAAREAYRLLGQPQRCGIVMRDGGHAQQREDWSALLDFADWQLLGKPAARSFHIEAFAAQSRGFAWSAPSAS